MSVLTPVAVPPRPEPPAVRPRPSTRGYWIGAALFVLTVAAAVAWLVTVWFDNVDRIDGFPRGPAPGSVAVSVAEGSTQVVYFEAPRGTAQLPLSELMVTGPDGAVLPVGAAAHDVRYDVPDRDGIVGRAVATFPADTAGTYRITVARGAPAGTVAVGEDITWKVVPHVIGAGAFALVGVSVALVLVVTTAMRRSRR